jgi:hypothetical protein
MRSLFDLKNRRSGLRVMRGDRTIFFETVVALSGGNHGVAPDLLKNL